VTFVPRRIRLLALLALVAGSLLLSACQQPTPRKLHGMTDKMPQSATRLPQPAPALPLTDQYGQPFSLSTQKGKVVIVYFGYTSCPDVCPVTLAQLTQVWIGLGQEQARLFQPIFVTVDPERDTEAVIDLYLSAFSRPLGDDRGLSFIGLRGAPAELDPVMAAYDVKAEKKPQPGSAVGYTVDHTAYTYVIDTAGTLLEWYPYGAAVDDILWDVRYLIEKGAKK
jgi:protein SCO1